MRRKIREAYRLARPDHILPDGSRIDLAFIYVADKLTDYQSVAKAVGKIMTKVTQSAAGDECSQ